MSAQQPQGACASVPDGAEGAEASAPAERASEASAPVGKASEGSALEGRSLAGEGCEDREALRREIAEHNALAAVFDEVTAASLDGRLSTPQAWADAGLVPDHMTPVDLEMMVYGYLEDWHGQHGHPEGGGSFLAADPLASLREPLGDPEPSAFASRAVGVPPAIGTSEPVGEPAADSAAAADAVSQEDPPPAAGSQLPEGYELVELEGELALVDAEDALVDDEVADEEALRALRVPDGYRLVQLDGEYVLLQEDPDALPQKHRISCASIECLVGAHSYYLYDASRMTGAYAHWAFLAAEDDPLITFVYCVREESRVYPRPMALESFANEPLRMEADEVRALFDEAQQHADYADIRSVRASNGDVYFYSDQFLEGSQAEALAEWHSVERFWNM